MKNPIKPPFSYGFPMVFPWLVITRGYLISRDPKKAIPPRCSWARKWSCSSATKDPLVEKNCKFSQFFWGKNGGFMRIFGDFWGFMSFFGGKNGGFMRISSFDQVKTSKIFRDTLAGWKTIKHGGSTIMKSSEQWVCPGADGSSSFLGWFFPAFAW